MLALNELTTTRISAHVTALQAQAIEALGSTAIGTAELLNPLDDVRHARFLAYRSPDAQAWQKALLERNVITDVRGDVLRIGFGLYNDAHDVARLSGIAGTL